MQLRIVTFCAFLLTALAVHALAALPFLTPWAVFIAWACFFHMEGGSQPVQGYLAALTHLMLGSATGWLTALGLLLNPLPPGAWAVWWGPLLIGAVVAGLTRLAALPRFSTTPAMIYGYAGLFAYLSAGQRFNPDALLSLTFDNGLIGMSCCHFVGVGAGYLNAMLVAMLVRPVAKAGVWLESTRTQSMGMLRRLASKARWAFHRYPRR